MKKKKEKIKGRAAAIIGMVALMLLSVPVGATVSLTREKNKALEPYNGSGSSETLLIDMENGSGEAADLVTLAKKYLSADDAQISAVQRAREALNAAETPPEQSEALSTLTASFNVLADALDMLELTEKDKTYLDGITADYNMYLDYISRNDYNARATEFNELLEASPMQPIASLVGIDTLELFR